MSNKPKMDINAATREQLLQDVGLRPAVADALLRHRRLAGALLISAC